MTTWYSPANSPPFGSSGESVATGSLTAITTTAQTDIGPDLSIPANTAAAGVCYRYHNVLLINNPGTATDVVATFAVYYGGIAGTALISNVFINTNNSVVSGSTYVEMSGFVLFTSATGTTAYLRSDGQLLSSGTQQQGFDRLSGAFSANTTGLTTTAAEVLTTSVTLSAVTGSASYKPIVAAAWRVA